MLYAGNQTCVCDYLDHVDYFPQKLTQTYADTFSVTYHKHYKVINVTANPGAPLVLYQCGTPRPNLNDTYPSATYIQIPIKRVMVASSTFIPWIEFLGERRSIVAVSQISTVSSPCVRKRFDEADDLIDVYDTATWSVDSARLDTASVDVAFCSAGWGCPLSSPNVISVPVRAQQETSVLAEAEHVEFFSLFYNREQAAMDVVDNIARRFTCVETHVPSQSVRPTVLWANYYYGWYVGSCPNYYCELVQAAGGDLITNFTTGSGPYGALTDSEFISAAEDADIFLYTGQNYWTADSYGHPSIRVGNSNKTNVLERIRAFQNGRVYDTLGNGNKDWFESRIAEPDVVLQDLLDIFYPHALAHTHDRVWWRRIEPENSVEPIGESETCANVSAPLTLKVTGTCAELTTAVGGVGHIVAVGSDGSSNAPTCDPETGAPLLCDEMCATCDGPLATNCLTCAVSNDVRSSDGSCISRDEAFSSSSSTMFGDTTVIVIVVLGFVCLVMIAVFGLYLKTASAVIPSASDVLGKGGQIVTKRNYKKGKHGIVDVEDSSSSEREPTKKPKEVHLFAVRVTLSHTEVKDPTTGLYRPQFEKKRRKSCAIAINYKKVLCIPGWDIHKLKDRSYYKDFHEKFVSKPYLSGKGSIFYEHALRLDIKTLRMTSLKYFDKKVPDDKIYYLIIEAEVDCENEDKNVLYPQVLDSQRYSKDSGRHFLKIEAEDRAILETLRTLILFHQDAAVKIHNLTARIISPDRVVSTGKIIGKGTSGIVTEGKIGGSFCAIKSQLLQLYDNRKKKRRPMYKDPDFDFSELPDTNKESRKMRYEFNFVEMRELKIATSIKVKNVLSTDCFFVDYDFSGHHGKREGPKGWQFRQCMQICSGDSLSKELEYVKKASEISAVGARPASSEPWPSFQEREEFHVRWHGNLIPTDPTNFEAYVTNRTTTPLYDDFNYLILEDIVRGMIHLHEEEIAHRDLKAANILLKWDAMSGRTIAKICDFGNSKSSSSNHKTGHTTFIGTPEFQAPELFTGVTDLFKLDVFAFAGVVYQMWTARIPFHDKEKKEMRDNVKGGIHPSEMKEIPFGTSVKEFLDECWQEDYSKRPSFIDIKRHWLERFKPKNLRKNNKDGRSWVQRKQQEIVGNLPRIAEGVRAWANDVLEERKKAEEDGKKAESVLEKRKSQGKADIPFDRERNALKQKLEDCGVDMDAYALYRPLTDCLLELHRRAYDEKDDAAEAQICRFYKAFAAPGDSSRATKRSSKVGNNTAGGATPSITAVLRSFSTVADVHDDCCAKIGGERSDDDDDAKACGGGGVKEPEK
eukprot:g581.t1